MPAYIGPPVYITPRGWKVIIDELTALVAVERPKVVREVSDAAAEGDRSENAAYIYGKRRLREIDRRAGFLQGRLGKAQVVDGRKQSREKVFFGAIVDLEDEDGEEIRYQIVGVDEVDAKLGRLSWQSPVGQALIGKRVGDTVRVKWHAGERELTVGAIDYLDDPPPGDSAAALRALALPESAMDDLEALTPTKSQRATGKKQKSDTRKRPAVRRSPRTR